MSLINAYVRVSSQEQGDSKLGIDAQIKAIRDYALTTGEGIKEIYIDVKSGKDTNRPELQKCIEMSIKENAKMVVAKSCRLSRDIADGFNIRKMKLNLVILDTDVKNIMDYGFRMMFNQHEREQISIRTKLALNQLKQRGVKLGKPENFTNESRAKGREVISKNAKENPQNKQATILIKMYKESNLTLQQICDKLNEIGMTTRHGKKFNPIQVKRLYDTSLRGETITENIALSL